MKMRPMNLKGNIENEVATWFLKKLRIIKYILVPKI
jgi:hypothetical protein